MPAWNQRDKYKFFGTMNFAISVFGRMIYLTSILEEQ